jgi:hypothetical protein
MKFYFILEEKTKIYQRSFPVVIFVLSRACAIFRCNSKCSSLCLALRSRNKSTTDRG